MSFFLSRLARRRLHPFPAFLLAGIFSVSALRAESVISLEPSVVTAARVPQPAEQVAVSVREFDGDEIRSSPTVTLDDALRAVPGFSLFRRSDSLTANPTAQGVSLRGLGPSGASRSLVLLDGVPLNDPFGGWVTWSELPRETLAGAELVKGGGATAWGNAALGGVVQVLTAPVSGQSERFAASVGDFATHSVEFGVTQPVGKGSVQLLGRAFETNGFSLVAPERRGTIDVPAASDHRRLTARWRTPLGENLEATLTARTFQETRNNGTPYQRNASRANFFSASLAGQPEKNFAWTATGYAQAQGFSSTFSSVNATRSAETPASDQFSVPATATGATWSGSWTTADGARTSAGVDFRAVRGETRENYNYTAGAFTRQRFAGGRQTLFGLFVLRSQPVGRSVTASFGARIDEWWEAEGHRREADRITGASLRDDIYPDHHDLEFSPSLGAVWRATDELRFRVAAQEAFRRPTLNELYRPFRQGSTVTEANPSLGTEHVTSGEAGMEWTMTHALTLSVTGFWNDLRNAVGNVTIAHGPGTFPIVGVLPVGGLGRQRLNLDHLRVRGIETSVTWHAAETLTFTAEAMIEDASVREASVAPALVGKRLAQVPRHSASLGATWRAPLGIKLTPRVRWIGSQFEDDENLLPLGEVVVADLGASYALGHGLELFLSVENLGNARVETGRSADGVVNTGTPRLCFGGIRGAW